MLTGSRAEFLSASVLPGDDVKVVFGRTNPQSPGPALRRHGAGHIFAIGTSVRQRRLAHRLRLFAGCLGRNCGLGYPGILRQFVHIFGDRAHLTDRVQRAGSF